MKAFKLHLGLALVACLWLSSPLVVSAAEEKSADPLGDIVLDMKTATRWLAKQATDALTLETQKDAVEKLDKLIEELQKECDKCNGARAAANPSRPARDSVIRTGPGGSGKLHAERDQGKHWADLPPHERERILQSMTEGFPSHYQGVLEEYFKRVAEEKPAKPDESAAPPTGDASAAPASPPASADGPAKSPEKP
jgi:hypothetical protein